MSTPPCGGLDPLAGLSALDDPVRQRLYQYIASRDEPVAREDAGARAEFFSLAGLSS
jgi:hypothetical protein